MGATTAEKLEGTSDEVDTDNSSAHIFYPIPSQYPVIASSPFHPFASLAYLSVSPLNLTSHSAKRKITKIVANVGGDQIRCLGPYNLQSGGYASHGSHNAVAPMV